MNKRNENPKAAAPNASDFLGGKFLKKEDLREPRTVTIVAVWSERVLNSDTPKLIVEFEELDKPLILNKTNTRRLIAMLGEETAAWCKRQVLLFVEQEVQYAGRVVGGIRLETPKVVNGAARENIDRVDELAGSIA